MDSPTHPPPSNPPNQHEPRLQHEPKPKPQPQPIQHEHYPAPLISPPSPTNNHSTSPPNTPTHPNTPQHEDTTQMSPLGLIHQHHHRATNGTPTSTTTLSNSELMSRLKDYLALPESIKYM